MKFVVEIPEESLEELKDFISKYIQNPNIPSTMPTDIPTDTPKDTPQSVPVNSEWLSLKDGAKYAGVSTNTFRSFIEKGLKIVRIEGITRVSTKEIDAFYRSRFTK